jgi:hypothetical protein
VSAWSPDSGEQFDWVNRRDLGIARAQQRAEREHEGWTDLAAEYLRDYSTRVAHGQPFLLEDARDASYGRVVRPSNDKAWGAAVQRAAKRGWLAKAGYAPARSSNGSPKCTWRAKHA